MIVVSGCPRSGTSLMMDLMRETFGEERIIGEKFPQEKRIKRMVEQQPNESDAQWQMRHYSQKKNGQQDKMLKEFEETKDMNPNGFWECGWTVRGIQYVPENNTPKPTDICKVVSQGLAASNPRYIDKVIYMLRHPRAVAKSQERLKGRFGGENPVRNGKEVTEHSPRMFVNVTKAAAHWLSANDVPYIIVDFDDLIENPQEQLMRVKQFLMEDGDFNAAIGRVEPKLRRSYPQDINHPLWGPAEELYDAMKAADFETAKDVSLEGIKREKNFMCVRTGRQMAENECLLCRTNEQTRRNYIANANRRGIEWRNEPCAYQCIEEGVTIEDSVRLNHWAGVKELKEYWCSRVGLKVNELQCKACQDNERFREGLKRVADENKINWRNQPCVYEETEGPEPHKQGNNHWL